MPFVNPDSVQRAATGDVVPAAWLDTINDDINYLHAGGVVIFTDTAIIASYATGGVVVSYGHTFTAVPFPVVGNGDSSAVVVAMPVSLAGTTSSFKVQIFDMSGAEVAASSGPYRVNWIVGGNV